MIIEKNPTIDNFLITTKEPFDSDKQVWIFINGVLSFYNEDLILDEDNSSIQILNSTYIDWDNDEISIFYEPKDFKILDYHLVYS